jgi:hypothetical protein
MRRTSIPLSIGRSTGAAAMLLALGLSPPASAQTQPEPRTTVAPVTVTAKLKPEELKSVVAHFVDQHAALDKKTGLLVRAAPSGICVTTQGLSDAYDAFVTRRIAEVARSVGAPVDKDPRCKPNVEVIFTDRPQALVDDLLKSSGGSFLGVRYAGEEHTLSRVTRPIQPFYETGTRQDLHPEATHMVDDSLSTDHDGDIKTGPSGLQPTRPSDYLPPAKATADEANGPQPFGSTGSRFAARHSSQFMNVLIVADLGKLDGRENGPMSDYIAVLALSQPRSLDTCNVLPSILDLLAAGCQDRPAPQAATDSDTAFLKALYASDITTSGETGRYHVQEAMAKGVVAAKP